MVNVSTTAQAPKEDATTEAPCETVEETPKEDTCECKKYTLIFNFN